MTSTTQTRAPVRTDSSFRFTANPLVPWTDVVQVYSAPGQQPTRSRLRTLRDHNLASKGVQVPRRSDTGVKGTAAYHSALSVWSARLRQNGVVELADQMRAAASKIEDTYSAHLRAYLLHHDFLELDKADFYPHLVKDTADALADFSWVDDNMRVVVGEVKRNRDAWNVTGQDRAGATWNEWVFPSILHRKNLVEGSHVVLTVRVTPSGLAVDVEPAVPLPTDEDLVSGPPFRSEEYVELSARYRAAGGRPPTLNERKNIASRHADEDARARKVTLGG